MVQTEKARLKIVRIVTASYVVPWHMANTLQRLPQDFEVTVVGQGVSVYRDTYPGIRWIDLDLDRKVSLFSDLRALLVLCRIFIAIKPDIVHSIMPKAGLLTAVAGFLCRVPVRLHTFTGQVWATRGGLAWGFYYTLDRLINTLNSVCLTDSPSQSAFLLEHGIAHEGKALPVLSKGSLSGVDLRRFDRAVLSAGAADLRRQLGLHEADFVFAFIARKTRDKGAIDILRAFAKVAAVTPSVRLLYVGPDESEGEVRKMLDADRILSEAVLEIGQVGNPELYLAISDVLCLPSHREGFGSIVIDAAALGIPAIGTRIPGLVDAIADNFSGVLFPQGDIEALATIMREALENPEKYRRMGANAKSRVVQMFSAQVLYDALRTLYCDLVHMREVKRCDPSRVQ
ncbi:MAG: glycosyltransferase [Gammaproteobacteria bacterium]|nr:glycosyltransferase [Gammaproteobacteria bacterium]MBU1624043.1 glycosyltransferase [Gammaproteobacteria bacterium]MBU1981771.1 glycosyltransferase [Gammaproteobacteria bacterium]